MRDGERRLRPSTLSEVPAFAPGPAVVVGPWPQTVAEKYCSAGLTGFANEAPLPPAKHMPTGLLVTSSTIRDPESPDLMKFLDIMIWSTNVARPVESPTRSLTWIACTVPGVSLV